MDDRTRPPETERLSLNHAASHILEECRMVVPGMQALFGFQLIAVFNAGFATTLGPGERRLHLAAIALIVVAIGLVTAPAAFHRRAEPWVVTSGFVLVSSHLLAWSMVSLALGMAADVYLVARVILDSRGGATAVAASLLLVLWVLWFALPRRWALRDGRTNADRSPEPRDASPKVRT